MFDNITNYQNYWIYSDFIKNKGEFLVDVNKDICKENWSNHFQAIHDILKDGIDDPDLAKSKLTLIICGHELKMTIHDYWLNLILWSLIIKAGDLVEPKHIFLAKEITAKSIKKYIDDFFISNHVTDIPFIVKNNMIADSLYYISKVDEFAALFANSINLQDDILMMDALPEYYNLLHPDMSNVDIAKANDFGMDNIRKMREAVLNSKKLIGYDHIYTNAFRANESINTKQLREYAVSIGTKPDGNGGVFPHIIANSFINGGVNDLVDYFIESSAGRTAQIISKINVGSSGAVARKVGLNNQGTKLNPDPNYKCTSRNFVKYEVKDAKVLELLASKYYRLEEDGFDLGPIKETDTHLIGKTIYTRSPMTCQSKAEGHGICRYCYGDLYFINQDIDPGKRPGEELTSNTTQRQLSAKHVMATEIPDLELPVQFVDNFVKNKETITLVEDKNYKDIYLVFNQEEIFKENEDDVDDSTDDMLEYNDYVSAINIIDHDTPYKIEIDKIDKFYLSKELTKFIKRKRYQTDEGEIIIPMTALVSVEDLVLFYTPIINNEFSKTLSRIKDIMDKSDVTASFNKDTIAQALMEALIDGGISMQATHIEVLLSNQIRNAYNIYDMPNWNNKSEPYQILTLSKALAENPSITKTLDFQNLGRILKSPSSFEKHATSTIDYFFQEQPQKFMNSPDLVRESNAEVNTTLTRALINDEFKGDI